MSSIRHGAALLALLLVTTAAPRHVRAQLIEEMTEAPRGLETTYGGTFEKVSSPVRGGKTSFRHATPGAPRTVGRTRPASGSKNGRSEITGRRTKINTRYSYGWSYYFPQNFPVGENSGKGFALIAQFATYPNVHQYPCKGNGSQIIVNRGEGRGTVGKVQFVFQRQGEGKPVECSLHELADISEVRGKWMDVAMRVNWTGDETGYLRLYVRVGGPAGKWVQKMNVRRARTYWNDEGPGPYFKMGLYAGAGVELVTDEYRLGGPRSKLSDVIPRGN